MVFIIIKFPTNLNATAKALEVDDFPNTEPSKSNHLTEQ